MCPASSRNIVVLSLLSLLAAAGSTQAADAPLTRLLGFTSGHAAAQLALERKFDEHISAADQKAWLEQMAAAPNHVGSPHDKANADFMLAKFKEWGWDAHIETFQVLYPTPKKVAVELIAPTHFVAKLREPAVIGDRTSTQIADELPPYHVYGADGDVTAALVYVNQGMLEDYKELAGHGIDVKGKIVIARYGGGWRGLKPKFAYEHGAIGCIVYSDPRDDGYGAGDAYPKGGIPPGRRRPARLGARHADLPWRSADAGCRCNGGCQAPRDCGRKNHFENSRAADVLRRCTAVTGGARRSGGAGDLARFAADYLSLRPGTGEGSPHGVVGLDHQADL